MSTANRTPLRQIQPETPSIAIGTRTLCGTQCLVQAALSKVHTGKGPLAAFHQHLIDVGKPFTVACTAAMRKLLTALSARVRDQKPWNAHPATTWL